MVLNESIWLLLHVWWYYVNCIEYLDESWYKIIILRRRNQI